MAMSIPRAHSVTQMMPADGWFFRSEHSGTPYVVRLAAWGLDHDGHVFGMISASTADFDSPHLVKVSSKHGVYLHKDELNPHELQLAEQRAREAVERVLRQAAAINAS